MKLVSSRRSSLSVILDLYVTKKNHQILAVKLAYMYEHLGCLYLCAQCVCLLPWKPEDVSNLLELKIKPVVSCQADAGNQNSLFYA